MEESSFVDSTVRRYLAISTAGWRWKYRRRWDDRTIDGCQARAHDCKCNRELVAASGVAILPLLAVLLLASAALRLELHWPQVTVSLHPHARAAGTPTGRSLFLAHRYPATVYARFRDYSFEIYAGCEHSAVGI